MQFVRLLERQWLAWDRTRLTRGSRYDNKPSRIPPRHSRAIPGMAFIGPRLIQTSWIVYKDIFIDRNNCTIKRSCKGVN